MRTLHLAALPFPTPQGTQAALHAMLEAAVEHGHETHLVCYGHGASEPSGPYVVHRARRLPGARSLRSGPAWEKLWLDAALAARAREVHARVRPELVIAHHVEAAALALALELGPVVFVAHTSLRRELPTYFSPSLMRPLAWAGGCLDRQLVRRAARALAVAPTLAALLTIESGRAVEVLPLPWRLPAPLEDDERPRARRSLGLGPREEVLLYAGNLDAYQGLDALLEEFAELARTRPALRLLLATASDPAPLARAAAALGRRERVRFTRLATEPERRQAYAAADLALVPRRTSGGYPIKLLDALARGVPVLAGSAALADRRLAPYCEVVAPGGWGRAVERSLADLEALRTRAEAGRDFVGTAHHPARFVGALHRHPGG